MYSGVQSALAPASMRTALPVRVGITGGHSGPANARNPLDQQGSAGENGAGTAGGEKCVAGAAFQQL